MTSMKTVAGLKTPFRGFPKRLAGKRRRPDKRPRPRVDALLDGRVFVKFHVDVGIGDVVRASLETMATHDWLALAETPAHSVAMMARERQFAKAYTLSRSNPYSRVRDFAEFVLAGWIRVD